MRPLLLLIKQNSLTGRMCICTIYTERREFCLKTKQKIFILFLATCIFIAYEYMYHPTTKERVETLLIEIIPVALFLTLMRKNRKE